jgi:hypothetical protein
MPKACFQHDEISGTQPGAAMPPLPGVRYVAS